MLQMQRWHPPHEIFEILIGPTGGDLGREVLADAAHRFDPEAHRHPVVALRARLQSGAGGRGRQVGGMDDDAVAASVLHE